MEFSSKSPWTWLFLRVRLPSGVESILSGFFHGFVATGPIEGSSVQESCGVIIFQKVQDLLPSLSIRRTFGIQLIIAVAIVEGDDIDVVDGGTIRQIDRQPLWAENCRRPDP